MLIMSGHSRIGRRCVCAHVCVCVCACSVCVCHRAQGEGTQGLARASVCSAWAWCACKDTRREMKQRKTPDPSSRTHACAHASPDAHARPGTATLALAQRRPGLGLEQTSHRRRGDSAAVLCALFLVYSRRCGRHCWPRLAVNAVPACIHRCAYMHVYMPFLPAFIGVHMCTCVYTSYVYICTHHMYTYDVSPWCPWCGGARV